MARQKKLNARASAAFHDLLEDACADFDEKKTDFIKLSVLQRIARERLDRGDDPEAVKADLMETEEGYRYHAVLGEILPRL